MILCIRHRQNRLQTALASTSNHHYLLYVWFCSSLLTVCFALLIVTPPIQILCLPCPTEPQYTNLCSTYQHTDCNQTEKARHIQHEHRIPKVALKADLTK